jgi:hypothetical protein
MFHNDTFIIAQPTFELIQKLQLLPELQGFYLVGGTSLALQIGHRNSIDIDLFTQNEFSSADLAEKLSESMSLQVSALKNNTLLAVIDNVKTDFIRHKYPLVNEPIQENGIIYLSKEDIAAMKLNAIINSGKRLKDFIDIYFLLDFFSVNEMLDFFAVKYANYNPLIALKALTYFDEIDIRIEPPKLRKTLRMTTLKKRIQDAVLHSNKKF